MTQGPVDLVTVLTSFILSTASQGLKNKVCLAVKRLPNQRVVMMTIGTNCRNSTIHLGRQNFFKIKKGRIRKRVTPPPQTRKVISNLLEKNMLDHHPH